MVPIRSLLVATDLSPFSFSAIDYALTLQLALGAQVHLLYVKRPGRGRARGPSETEAAEELRAAAVQAGDPGEDAGVAQIQPHHDPCRVALVEQVDDACLERVEDAALLRRGEGDAHVAGEDPDPRLRPRRQAAEGDAEGAAGAAQGEDLLRIHVQ